jgi:uncharacterized membrane protein
MKKLSASMLLLFVVGLGVAARCFAISERSIWFDESFSWGITQFPVPELLRRVAEDVHPPLYYLVLKGWTALWDSSVVAMRSLSVLWGGLSIVAMYLFVVEAFGSPTGDRGELGRPDARGLALLTAALVATSVFQVRYAWEIRMYAQGSALAALSHWALFRAIRGGSRPTRWLIWSLVSTAFAYTHYFSFFSLAAQGLFVAAYLLWPTQARRASEGLEEPDPRARIGLSDRSRTLVAALVAGLLVVVLYIPWVPPFLMQRSVVQESFWTWPVDRWSVPATIYQMLLGGPATDTFERGLEHGPMVVCTALVVVGLVILFLSGSASERFLVVSCVVPFGLATALSMMGGRSIYSNRFFSFAQLALLAAVAALIWRIPWSRLRSAVGVLAVAANAAICLNFMHQLDVPNRPGNRGTVELLLSRAAADDLVVVANSRVFFPMIYYSAGRFEPRLLFVPDRIEHFGGRTLLDLGTQITLEELWASRARQIWVVHSGGFGGLTVPVPADWVPADVWVLPELYWWQGEIVVTRYAPPPDRTPTTPPKSLKHIR